MTSKLTRERARQIFLGNGPEPSASEERELARMALAAMDSESGCLPLDYLQGHKDGLEWAAQLAEANHPETGDWLYDDPIELAKAIRKGPDMPPAQPAADSEPVIVVGDDGGDALSYRRLIQSFEPGTKLYLHAQPALVVPDDVLDALQKVARIRLDMNDFDGDRRGIADCLCDAEEALIEVVNRRAAMLQTQPQNAPQNIPEIIPDCWCRTCRPVVLNDMRFVVCPDCGNKRCPRANDHRNACTGSNEPGQKGSAYPAAPQSPGSEPATVPGKWIPVRERMPPRRYEVLVGRWWGEKPRWCCKWATYIPGHPDSQSSGWLIPGGSWTPTHWMELPAAPQEVR